jgi:porphobilinogen synthase
MLVSLSPSYRLVQQLNTSSTVWRIILPHDETRRAQTRLNVQFPEMPAHTPTHRPRRLRQSETLRRMVRETTLAPSNFIYPLFVQDGEGVRQPISAMPGQFRYSVDQLEREARHIAELGISAVILFGIPSHKDAVGSDNYDPNGVIARAIRTIKDAAPDLIVISDMCFCEYTDHGHCGLINQPDHKHFTPNLPMGYLLNDPTLSMLARASVVHADAGADIIAPSGMMDGMVGAIRDGLDAHGFQHVAIMSYAVKTASGFYGPFREAAESAPSFGDRHQYQMDPANGREALREVALDVAEGADMLMIKPALPNLDILSAVRQGYLLPTAAYQVSGEYAMLQAAGQHGWIDLRRCAMESLVSIKRAGADMIVTYFAREAAEWLG